LLEYKEKNTVLDWFCWGGQVHSALVFFAGLSPAAGSLATFWCCSLGRRQREWELFVVNIRQLIVIDITGLFMHSARSCWVIWVLVRVIRDPKPVIITVRRNIHIQSLPYLVFCRQLPPPKPFVKMSYMYQVKKYSFCQSNTIVLEGASHKRLSNMIVLLNFELLSGVQCLNNSSFFKQSVIFSVIKKGCNAVTDEK
jgi:hypothetical protein